MSNEEKINAEKTLQDIERDQLNLLIKRGFRFSLTYTQKKKRPGLPGIFGKKETQEHKEDFEIQEPTLSVLDRLSDAWMEMKLNEDELQKGGSSTIEEAKRVANENSKRMARIVAIAVLGENYHIKELDRTGRIIYRQDQAELDRLTALFFHTIQPSKLVVLANAITNMANLGDFISSMRFMSTRTTEPRVNRIE